MKQAVASQKQGALDAKATIPKLEKGAMLAGQLSEFLSELGDPDHARLKLLQQRLNRRLSSTRIVDLLKTATLTPIMSQTVAPPKQEISDSNGIILKLERGANLAGQLSKLLSELGDSDHALVKPIHQSLIRLVTKARMHHFLSTASVSSFTKV